MDFSVLLDSGFLGDLLRALIEVVMAIIGVILTPLGYLIASLLPNLDEAMLKVPELFNYAATYMGWIISAFAIPSLLLTVMLGYYLFVLTTKLTVWPIKLAISWYHTLKL